MALPSTVPGNWSDHLANRHGPFSTDGTNRYAFSVDRANSKIRAYKSTDYGQTWTQQDSANAPATGAVAGYQTCDVVQRGSTFHVLCGAAVGTGLSVIQFAADTWGASTTVTTGGPGGGTGILASGSPAVAHSCLAVRSNGDYVVLYQTQPEIRLGLPFERFVSQVYNGSTWSAMQVWVGGVNISYSILTCVAAASDRVHAWYQRSAAGFLLNSIAPSTNALGTEQSLSSLAGPDQAGHSGQPVSWIKPNGDNEIAMVFQNSGTSKKVMTFVSGANPTVTQSAFATTAPNLSRQNGGIAIFSPYKLASSDTNVTTVVAVASDGGTNTWGSFTTVETSSTAAAILNNWFADAGKTGQSAIFPFIISNGCMGLLWVETGGTIKYDQLLATPVDGRFAHSFRAGDGATGAAPTRSTGIRFSHSFQAGSGAAGVGPTRSTGVRFAGKFRSS